MSLTRYCQPRAKPIGLTVGLAYFCLTARLERIHTDSICYIEMAAPTALVSTKRGSKVNSKYYAIEEIRAVKRKSQTDSSVTHVLVKWEGYDESENTWEPVSNLSTDKKAMLDKFESCKNQWMWEYYLDKAQDGMKAGWHLINPASWPILSQVFYDYCCGYTISQATLVASGKYKYQLDFDAMQQTNAVHKDHTVRPIRCRPIYPPVA